MGAGGGRASPAGQALPARPGGDQEGKKPLRAAAEDKHAGHAGHGRRGKSLDFLGAPGHARPCSTRRGAAGSTTLADLHRVMCVETGGQCSVEAPLPAKAVAFTETLWASDRTTARRLYLMGQEWRDNRFDDASQWGPAGC